VYWRRHGRKVPFGIAQVGRRSATKSRRAISSSVREVREMNWNFHQPDEVIERFMGVGSFKTQVQAVCRGIVKLPTETIKSQRNWAGRHGTILGRERVRFYEGIGLPRDARLSSSNTGELAHYAAPAEFYSSSPIQQEGRQGNVIGDELEASPRAAILT